MGDVDDVGAGGRRRGLGTGGSVDTCVDAYVAAVVHFDVAAVRRGLAIGPPGSQSFASVFASAAAAVRAIWSGVGIRR